jgi:hypothetical protein
MNVACSVSCEIEAARLVVLIVFFFSVVVRLIKTHVKSSQTDADEVRMSSSVTEGQRTPGVVYTR